MSRNREGCYFAVNFWCCCCCGGQGLWGNRNCTRVGFASGASMVALLQSCQRSTGRSQYNRCYETK